MKKIFGWILNTVFFLIIILIAVSVATISLTKKVNEYRNENLHEITATVEKDDIPIVTLGRGIVKKVHVKEGEEVRKGSLIIELDNPTLQSRLDVLGAQEDNVSALTEASVAREELKNLRIATPVTGVVGEIKAKEGTPVEDLSVLANIYSNEDVKVLAEVTVAQYQILQRMATVRVYSERLNQYFEVVPAGVMPKEKDSMNGEEKKIGLYLTLKNNQEAAYLLHNEDLGLQLSTDGALGQKPIDFFIDFWNSLLGKYS